MELTKKQIVAFLNKKGMEHRLEGDKIVVKHCPMDYHKEKWCVKVWFENTRNEWDFVCNGSIDHYNKSFPFTEFIRLCEHNIDKIRNKQIKIK